MISQSGGLPIVCKIDAEGAEYLLLPALAEAQKLGSVSAWIMEYAGRDDETLPRLLHGSGFRVTRCLPANSSLAFLYAAQPPWEGIFDRNAWLNQAHAAGEAHVL